MAMASGMPWLPEVRLTPLRHQTLVSIAGGTLCYVLLVQMVF